MLYVKTYLDLSEIHGIGLFAGEFIESGTKIWAFTPSFDQNFSDEQLLKLTDIQRETILNYGYRSSVDTDAVVILCCDNARHFNFSVTPNCAYKFGTSDKYNTYAIRDIQIGEELTYSVTEDQDAQRKLGDESYKVLTNK